MQEDIHHIKTFELNTDWRSIRKYSYALQRGKCDLFEAREDFLLSYLPHVLGRELTINETKGVKCVRIFYDKSGEAIWLIAYDKSGYIDLELNLEYSRKENNSSVEEEPDEKVYTTVFQEELFDARGAIARTPTSAPEVVVQQDKYILHFKKIPSCRYDIHMKDPFWLYHTVTGVEARFYELGYKLAEATHKDVDGIIAGSRHMYYDRKGVFLKRVYMCGTPWGGALVCDEEIWDYNFRENTATMKEISVRRNSILNLRKYKMDEQGRIRERKEYMYPRNKRLSDPADQSIEKLVHSCTLHYAYGKNGKLCEVKTIFSLPTGIHRRHVYEYDTQGRLVAQRDYDKKNNLIADDTYLYLNDTHVECTAHIYNLQVLQ